MRGRRGKEGRKWGGRKEGNKEGRKEGEGGRKERRKEGRKEGRRDEEGKRKMRLDRGRCLFVCLLPIFLCPRKHAKYISRTDLLRQLYMLPH